MPTAPDTVFDSFQSIFPILRTGVLQQNQMLRPDPIESGPMGNLYRQVASEPTSPPLPWLSLHLLPTLDSVRQKDSWAVNRGTR